MYRGHGITREKALGAILCLEIFLMLYFNVGKFNIINSNDEYRIFPWMNPGQKSSSEKNWLSWHLFIALTLAASTAALSVFEINDIDILLLNTIHSAIHFIFLFNVAININHFGEYRWETSVIIQGIPWMILFILNIKFGPDLWHSNYKWLYNMALFSAPITEQILYLYHKLI